MKHTPLKNGPIVHEKCAAPYSVFVAVPQQTHLNACNPGCLRNIVHCPSKTECPPSFAPLVMPVLQRTGHWRQMGVQGSLALKFTEQCTSYPTQVHMATCCCLSADSDEASSLLLRGPSRRSTGLQTPPHLQNHRAVGHRAKTIAFR